MKSPHILQEQMESAIYNLLSNSLHSLPLGLSNNSINCTPFFNNFFQPDQLLVIALQVGYIYTAHVVKDYLNLRKHLYSLLTEEEKKTLKSYMSTTDLVNFIHALSREYEKDFFNQGNVKRINRINLILSLLFSCEDEKGNTYYYRAAATIETTEKYHEGLWDVKRVG